MTRYADIRSAIRPFEKPILTASISQLVVSIVLFIGACALMYWSLQFSYFLTLLLALPAGAFLVRVFIIQHDCGHGSFFASHWANAAIGRFCSLLTLTPYSHWRRQHAGHHATWNNLDKRYSGADIYSTCLTVAEYSRLTPWERFRHRLLRHPLISHVILPPLVFLVLYRVPFDTPDNWIGERREVYILNLALVTTVYGLGTIVGFLPVLLVQVPVTLVTSIIGVWLFAVQHRFENARWAPQASWNYGAAALDGSSHLKLPRLLQWLTGNIGFHHIHHFAPRVPNYRLEACYRSIPLLREQEPLTIRVAFRSIRLSLWDEASERLVAFKDVKIIPEMMHVRNAAT